MANKKLQQPKNKSAKLLKLEAQMSALEKEQENEIKRLKSKERDRDTRRKILAGQAVLKEALRQAPFRKYMYKLLDKDLRKQYDRDIFDDLMEEWEMPPLPRLAPVVTTASPSDGQSTSEAGTTTTLVDLEMEQA